MGGAGYTQRSGAGSGRVSQGQFYTMMELGFGLLRCLVSYPISF